MKYRNFRLIGIVFLIAVVLSGYGGFCAEDAQNILTGSSTALNAPTNLTANVISSSQVYLAWTDNATREDGFILERKTGDTGAYEQVSSLPENATCFTDTTVSEITTYYYRVCAYQGAGRSAYSNEVFVTTPWTILTLVPQSVGSYTPLAIDSNNKVHICYFDNSTYALKLITNATGVDWVSSVVDTQVGEYASFALDRNNKAHISYYDRNNVHLKYATNTTGTWQTYTIDPNGYTGFYSSIAVDTNNKIHISYYDNTSSDLKYATNISGSWVITTIDSDGYVGLFTSIASRQGGIHISYYDQTNGDLKYVTNQSGSWVTSTVDATGNVGYYTGTTIDSNGKAHISYHDLTNNDLKYATNTSGSWQIGTVDDTGDTGRFTAITLDSTNTPHISYYNVTSQEVKYARLESSAWVRTVVDSVRTEYTAIALETNKVHIAYTDAANHKLKYASHSKGNWQVILPPVNLAATAMSTSQIDLRWTDNANNEDGFRIERKSLGDTNYQEIASLPINSTAYSDRNLVIATSYSYRLRAWNSGGSSAYSNEAVTSTLYSQPAIPFLAGPANNTTNIPTNITLSWSTSGQASYTTSYQIQIGRDSAFTIMVADISDITTTSTSRALDYFTGYYWRVRGQNPGGIGGWSETWSFTTMQAPPDQPGLILPIASETGVALTPALAWSPANRASSYRIQLSADSAFSTTIINQPGITATQFSWSATLSYGTMYYWRVQASNLGGTGAWSDTRTFTTVEALPVQPTLILPSNNAVGFAAFGGALSWDADSYAASYQLQVSIDSNFQLLTSDIIGITTTSYFIPSGSLGFNTLYYWRVRSVNAAGSSIWSTIWQFTTNIAPPATVTLVSPVNDATDTVTNPVLSWNTSDTATSYKLELATDSGFSVNYQTLTTTNISYALVSLLNATTYYWRVAGVNTGGQGDWSATRSFTTIITVPPQPVLSAPQDGATVTEPVPILSWNAVVGVTSYRLQIATDTGFAEGILLDQPGITATNWQTGGLANGQTYYWRVRAANVAGDGYWSSVWQFAMNIQPPVTPALSTPVSGAAAVALNSPLAWVQSSGATSYQLQIATGSGFTDLVVNQSGIVSSSFSPSVLSYSTQYYWRVRAANAAGSSDWSASWTFITLLPPPILVSPSNDPPIAVSTVPTLIWNSVAGATEYQVQVSESADFGVRIADLTLYATYYLLPSALANGTTYYWRVRGANTGGAGEWSTPWSFQTNLTPPTFVFPVYNATDVWLPVTLTWQSSTGAASYQLQVATDSGFTGGIVVDQGSIVSLFFSPSVLQYATQYYWRVRAGNIKGTSGWSLSGKFTTIIAAPDQPVLTVPANGAINTAINPSLQWNSSARAASYRLQLSTDSNFQLLTSDITGITAANWQTGTLANWTTYYWRVRAGNVGGESAWSQTFSFTTIIAAPAIPILQSPVNGATGVVTDTLLSWYPAERAADYQLQVATHPAMAGTDLVYDISGIPTTSITQLLDYFITYYWRVRSNNTGGQSGWSEPRSFNTIIIPPDAPALSYPADVTIDIPLKVTLTWNASFSAVSYRLLVARDSNFTDILKDTSGIETTSYYLVWLENQTVYYWKVQASNSAGPSPWTTPRSFTTVLAPPAEPVLIAPDSGAAGLRKDPTLTWNAVPTALSYQLRIATDVSFYNIVFSQTGIAATSITQSLNYSLTYYWQVKAVNGGGESAWSGYRTFTTIHTPVLASPLNNQLVSSSPTLNWNDALGATLYQLQVATDSAFANIIISEPNLAVTSYALSGLSVRTYFWRVKSSNTDTSSDWSAPWGFVRELANANGGAWQYFRPITISNNTGAPLTDYQIPITPFTDSAFLNNTGLVGSWRLSEGAGQSAVDMSGSANNGTLSIGGTGSQTTTAQSWTNGVNGRFGQALSFDGTDDYVSVPDSDYWNLTSLNVNGTIEMWIKANTLSGNNGHGLINQINNDQNWALYVYNNGSIAVGKAGINEIVSSPGIIVPGTGQWYHIVTTKSGSTTTIYVNGTSIASNTTAVWTDTANLLRIGGHRYSNTDYYFNGLIDEVKVYNRALSATEVFVRYNAGTNTGVNRIANDYADIRFVNSAHQELSFWQESDSRFWVKVPSLTTGDSVLKMLYGNISATSVSNITNTFIFGDDFSAGTLDAARWPTNQFAPDNYSITGGVLKVWSDGGNWKGLASAYNPGPNDNVIIEALYRTEVGNNMIIYCEETNNRFAIQPYLSGYAGPRIQYNVNGGAYQYGSQYYTAAANNWYIHRIDRQSPTTFRAYTFNTGYTQLGTDTQVQNDWSAITFTYRFVEQNSVNSYLDWVRVRKYAAPEPGTSSPGTEQQINTTPSLLATVYSDSRIDLAWVDNSITEDGFKIERQIDGGAGWVQIGVVYTNITSFSDTTVTPTNTYSYRVRAYDSAGNYAWSNVDVTHTAIPLDPVGLITTTITSASIGLQWESSSNNETGFEVWRSTDGANYELRTTTNRNAISYTDTGLSYGPPYWYKVRAYNGIGQSADTNTVGPVRCNLSNNGNSIWNYYRPITITNSGGALTEYQVKLTLTTSVLGNPYANIKSGGADVRFVAVDGLTECPYWIESWNSSSTSTVWVKIPALPATGDFMLRMYYGNSAATASSNGNNTFMFFDDFDTLDTTTKWDKEGNTWGINTGKVEVPASGTAGVTFSMLRSKTFTINNGIIETVVIPLAIGGSQGKGVMFRTSDSNNLYTADLEAWTASNTELGRRVGGAWTNLTSVATTGGVSVSARYKIVATFSGTSLRNDVTRLNTSQATTTSTTDSNFSTGKVGLYVDRDETATGAQFEYILVRKWATTEPSAVVSTAQTPINSPSLFIAAVYSTTQIDLTWQDNAASETGYEVWASIDDVNYALVSTLPANTASWSAYGLTPGINYWYKVRAFDAGGTLPWSEVAATGTSAPSAPSGLVTTTVTASSITMGWNDLSNNESGFEVWRTTDGSLYALRSTLTRNTTSFTDTGLLTATAYAYKILAYNGIGNSDYSSTVAQVTASPWWWNSNWRYRAPVTINTGNYGSIINENIFKRINFNQLLPSGALDVNSLRVIDPSRTEQPGKIAYNYGGDNCYVWFYADGTIPTQSAATYWLYFDTTDNPKSAPSYSKSPPPDVAVQYHDNGVVKIMGNYNGGFTLYNNTIPTPGSGSHNNQGIADFDNDGDLDYVMSRYGDSNVYYYRNNGGGDGFANFTSMGSVGTRVTSSHWMGCAVADFNEDGNMDFVAFSDETYEADLFTGNGAGGFTKTAGVTSGGVYKRECSVGDFDEDGNMDIALGPYNTYNWYVYYGNGAGGFTTATYAGNYGGSNADCYAMAAGDWNHDGHLDIICGGAYYGYDGTARRKFQGIGNANRGTAGFTDMGYWTGANGIDIGDGSRSDVHGWAEGYDWNHDGYDDVIGHNYCDNVTAQAGIRYWQGTSAAWGFNNAVRLGPGTGNWMGHGTTSPRTGHNLGFTVTVGQPETETTVNVTANLAATVILNTRIDLAWQDNSPGENGFKIERSPEGITWTVIAELPTPNLTTYSDTTVTATNTYYYRVRSYNFITDNPASSVISSTAAAPAAPSGLVTSTVTSSEIGLRWTDNSNNETEFELHRSTDGTNYELRSTLNANTTAVTDSGLTTAITYWYKVQAYNLLGVTWGNVISATTSGTIQLSNSGNGQWRWSKPITVTNSGAALTDYQVLLTPFTDANFLNNTGLVGSWHFSEGSGQSAADMSGNGNTGTLNGTSYWTTSGKFGNGFNGSGDDYVTTGYIPQAGAKSLAFWVYYNTVSTGDYQLQGTQEVGAYFYSGIQNGGVGYHYLGNAGGTYAYTFSAGQWYFVVETMDGIGTGAGTIRTYVNGAQVATLAYSASANSTLAFWMGKLSTNIYPFNAIIDEVLLFNRALSASEIALRYNANAPKVKGDYSDIRFTNAANTSELAYWQETDSRFWVKVPVISATPTTTLINMVYGNVSATSSSSVDNTMQKLTTSDWGSNIKLLYSFDGNANDLSGNGNNGTISGATWIGGDGGAPAFTTGNCLSFNGSSDRVGAPNSASLGVNTSGLTVVSWVYLLSAAAGQPILLNKENSYECAIGGGTANRQMNMAIETDAGGSWAWGEASEAVPLNQWTHLAYVHDNTTWRFYRDGVEKSTIAPAGGQTGNITPSTGYFGIGARSFDGVSWSNFLNARIDEVAVFNRTLNTNEIKCIYQRRKYASTEPTTAVSTAENRWGLLNLSNPGTGAADNWAYYRTITVSNTASPLVNYALPLTPFTDNTFLNNTGLVGSWHFSEGGSATTTADMSGNNNNGTLTIGGSGSQTTASQAWSNGSQGRFGQALSFDGTDDYVNCGNAASLNLTGEITVEAWIKISALTGQDHNIIIRGSDGVEGYRFCIAGGTAVRFDTYSPTKVYTFGTNTITVGNWHHVAAVRNGTSVRVYQDGVDVSSVIGVHGNPVSSIRTLKIGVYENLTDHWFKGIIDEVRIYNRALSAPEITARYNNNNPMVKGDYTDVRFTDAASGQELSYWQESDGRYWVRIPTLTTATSSIRIYYGNVSATASSSLSSVWGSGLTGYWPFSEGTGTATLDKSGNANNGTVNGATWTASGRFGNALAFDGVNDYVSVAPNWGTIGTGDFSILLWINNAGLDGDHRVLVCNQTLDNFQFALNNGGVSSAAINMYLGSGVASNSLSWTLGQWYHLVVTRQSGTVSFYRNGVSVGTATNNGNVAASSSLSIGFRSFTGNHPVNGRMDEVQIYTRALTASEIASRYAATDPAQGAPGAEQSTAGGIQLSNPGGGNWAYKRPITITNNSSLLTDYQVLLEPFRDSGDFSGDNLNNTGLVGCWNMSEGTGSTTADASGSGNTGTLVNSPTWTTGRFGNGLQFNNAGSTYVSVPDSASLDLTTDISVECWINANSLANNMGFVTKGAGGYSLGLYTTGKLSWGKNSVDEIQSVQTLTTGRWYHIVGTRTGGVDYLYIDGKLDNSAARASFDNTANPVYIGSNNVLANWYLNGIIDEVKVWNRALTAEEAATRYGSGLVGSWHFSEGSGTTAADMSGQGNNGTWNGSGVHWDAAGRFGSAGKFNGTDDYVSIPDSDLWAFGANNFSIEAWINLNATPNYWSIIEQWQDGSNFWACMLNGTEISFFCTAAGGPNMWTVGANIQTGSWYHVVMVRNISNYNIYVNGVSKGSTSSSAAIPNYAVNPRMGTYQDAAPDRFWNGLIDEPRVYKRALSAAEIALRYNANAPKVKHDYADVRFTNADATAEYSYWQETDSRFWVKVPSLPATQSSLRLYYGNVSATNSSSGTNTFLAFDDFSTNQLGTYWLQDTSFFAVSNGELSHTGGALYHNLYHAVNLNATDNWKIYGRNKVGGGNIDAYIGVNDTPTQLRGLGNGIGIRPNSSGVWEWGKWVSGAETSLGQGGAPAGVYHKLEMEKLGTTFKAYANGLLVDTETVTEFNNTYFQIESYDLGYYDMIYMRKFSTVEPTSAPPGPEQ